MHVMPGLYGCCMHTGLAHHVLCRMCLHWGGTLADMLIDVAIGEVGPCDEWLPLWVDFILACFIVYVKAIDYWPQEISHSVHVWARFLTAGAGLLTCFWTCVPPTGFKPGWPVYNLLEWLTNWLRLPTWVCTYIDVWYLECMHDDKRYEYLVWSRCYMPSWLSHYISKTAWMLMNLQPSRTVEILMVVTKQNSL